MDTLTINIPRFSRDIAMIFAMMEHVDDTIAKKMIVKSCCDMLDTIAAKWFIDDNKKAEENFRAIFDSMDFETKETYVKSSSYGEHVVLNELFPEFPIFHS